MRPATLVANVLSVASLTFSIFMAGCGGGSGAGHQPPPPPPQSNSVPVITSLNPNSATQGGNPLTVTIAGYNFI
jgi:hypothetical protein